MTFKHTKFEDSPIMRSLEKVAKEKGMVKADPIVKQAAKQENFAPSHNLTSNLLKLCSGLRSAGLTKAADELEHKFLNFKQAQTMYDTHGEKGEDLIHDAHPKGSHKLEGVEGDEATFEDILDKHMKILEVVNKKPSGKLSSASAINAVKMVLADEDPSTGLSQPVVNYIMSFFKLIDESLSSDWNRVTGLSQDGQIAYNRLKSNFITYINNQKINNSTIASLNSMIDEAVKGFSSRDASRLFYISDEAEKIIYQLKSLKNYIADTVMDDHKKMLSAAPKASESVQQFSSQIKGYLDTLNNWQAAVNNDPENSPDDKKQANGWIEARRTELNELQSNFKPEQADGFLIALNKSKFVKESAQFKKIWIG